jgi:hypothetical protein
VVGIGVEVDLRIVLIGLLLSLTACYGYVPVNGELPPRPTVVRTYLSEPSSFTIDQVSLHGIDQVEGEVVQWQDDYLVVSASWLWSISGQEFGGNSQTLIIPRERLQIVERKKLSKARTAGIVGVGALLATLMKIALPTGSASGGVPGGGTNPK